MAAGRLLLPSWMPALDSDGNPIPNAKVFFYVNLTTTLAPVYADEALTTPLANPVEANASGRFPAVWADDSVLYSASVEAPYGPAGVPFTYDNLSVSIGADILIAEAAEAAADDAQAALAGTLAAIQAAQDADGDAAVAGALAGAAAANAVVAGKANIDGGNITSGSDWRTAIDAPSTDGDGVDPTPFRTAIGLEYSTQAQAEAATDNASTMTPLRTKDQLRTVVEYINPREPSYAGGAIVDGVADCRAALQAAIDYAKTLGTRLGGGCIKVRLPAGVMNFTTTHPVKTDRVIDFTGCDNVVLEGEGIGASTVRFTPNVAWIRNDDLYTAPLFSSTMKDFTIIGPYLKATSPGSNLLSAGIYLGATNSCLLDTIRIYSCATGVTWADSFHSEIVNLRMNGQDDLAVRDGLYARDGDVSLAENSVGIYGGRVFGCGRYGFRAECLTGTCVFGLEVLGCGGTGVYFGDSPAGKELKWFTWVGGLIDTCPDLLIVSKGTSTAAHLMHWSGMWLGAAVEGSDQGKGIDFRGLTDCTIRADILVNTDRGVELDGCDRITVDVGSLVDYDRTSSGNVAVLLNNTLHSTVRIGSTKKTTGGASATALLESGTSNYNLITGVFDGAVTTIGAQSNKVGTIVY